MRRRLRGGRTLSAEQLSDLYVRTVSQYAGASLEVRNHALRLALGEHGYDPLDAIRARYWLRRGKPANYRWDDAAFPQDRFSEVLDTYTPSGSAHRATEGNQP